VNKRSTRIAPRNRRVPGATAAFSTSPKFKKKEAHLRGLFAFLTFLLTCFWITAEWGKFFIPEAYLFWSTALISGLGLHLSLEYLRLRRCRREIFSEHLKPAHPSGRGGEEGRPLDERSAPSTTGNRILERMPLALVSKAEPNGHNGRGLLPSSLHPEEREKRAEEETARVEVWEESLAQPDDFDGPGIFIRTPNPLDLGEEFTLKLHLTDGGGPIEVRCRVIWTNRYGKESKHLHRGMGVRFLEIQPKVQRRLDEFLRLRKSRGGGEGRRATAAN
jgi:hypothetical protein